jgi:hypothetical protein
MSPFFFFKIVSALYLGFARKNYNRHFLNSKCPRGQRYGLSRPAVDCSLVKHQEIGIYIRLYTCETTTGKECEGCVNTTWKSGYEPENAEV